MTIRTDRYIRELSVPGGEESLFALFGQKDPVKRDADIQERFEKATAVGKKPPTKFRFPVPRS